MSRLAAYQESPTIRTIEIAGSPAKPLRSLFGFCGQSFQGSELLSFAAEQQGSARQRADLTALPISQDRAIARDQRRAEIARGRQQDTVGGIARRRAGQE